MEIILKQDVDTLGNKDQIVNVKPGYANNFLIPQGYAAAATASAKKILAENIRQQAHKEAKLVADATAIVDKLATLTLTIAAKANEDGKIFGTITSTDIATALSKHNFDLDKRNIKVDAIKEIGQHKATVKIYKDIKAEVNLNITAQE